MRKYYVVAGLIVMGMVIGTAIIVFPSKFSDANYLHQQQASGILTMQECLKCHDGITGKLITVCLGNECLYLKEHSLMHQYPPPSKQNDYASVVEIESAGCILEAGKVTCLSCHDLTKPPPHLIQEGDKLCLICHKNLRSKPL
jgi:hypothetical protein